MVNQKDIEKLVKQIEKTPGWEVRQQSKHRYVYPPDKSIQPIKVAGSAGDWRSYANFKAQLKRAGFPL